MRAEKRNFLVKIFQKVPKNALFDCFFFKNLSAAQKILPKMGAKQCFGRAQKNQFDRPKKKKVVKIFDFFMKVRPPPENILDPHLHQWICYKQTTPSKSTEKFELPI